MRDCPTVLSEDGLIFWDLERPHRLPQAPLTETKGQAIARGSTVSGSVTEKVSHSRWMQR